MRVAVPGPRPAGTAARSAGHVLGRAADGLLLAAGVAAIVVALAVAHAASTFARSPDNGLVPGLVVVAASAPSISGVQQGLVAPSLTPDDVTALGNRGFVPGATAVVPTTGLREVVVAGARSVPTDLIGTTASFGPVRGYRVATGRALTAQDVADAAPVAVVGRTVVDAAFGGGDAVGQVISVAGQQLRVVGTFAAKGFSGSLDQDDLVVTPIGTAWSLSGTASRPIDQILVQASTPSATGAVARQVDAALLRQHGISDPAAADFTVRTQRQAVGPGLAAANGYKRVLEVAGALLLLGGAVVLGRTRLGAARAAPGRPTALRQVAGLLGVGIASSVVGALLGHGLAPRLHRANPQLPVPHAAIPGLLLAGALGVAASVVAALPLVLGGGPGAAAGTEPGPEPPGPVAELERAPAPERLPGDTAPSAEPEEVRS